MPIGFSKRSRVRYVLPADKDADGEQPYFEYRFMDCSESLEYLELLEKAAKAEEDQNYRERDQLQNQIACIALAGWSGMKDKADNPVEFDANDPVSAFAKIYLTPNEKWQVAYESKKLMRLTEEELKNSESQQGEAQESSAQTVPPVAA